MTPDPQPARCICPEHADARTCWELRYYGYSPVARFVQDDPDDGECECPCHDGGEADEWDW